MIIAFTGHDFAACSITCSLSFISEKETGSDVVVPSFFLMTAFPSLSSSKAFAETATQLAAPIQRARSTFTVYGIATNSKLYYQLLLKQSCRIDHPSNAHFFRVSETSIPSSLSI